MTAPNLLTFYNAMRFAAIQADTRRAGVLVAMFEREYPADYRRLYEARDDAPGAALERLTEHYTLLKMVTAIPNWESIVRFIQECVRNNEHHKALAKRQTAKLKGKSQ